MARQGTLIVLGGFAGAGKTTIAKKLAQDHNYAFFNPDDFNAGLMSATSRPFHELSPLAYETLWHVLKKNLAMSITCILDANMCNIRTWETLDTVRSTLQAQVIPIILECSLDTHKLRIEKRSMEDPEHLNLGGDAWENIVHKYEFIQSLERPDLIRIDANGSIDEVYKKVLDILHISL